VRQRAPKLSLSIQIAAKSTQLPTRAQLRRWAQAALASDGAVTLRIVDEFEGRALNYQFRRKDYATNVLTFVYQSEPTIEGDIALCAPVIAAEAAAQRKSDEAHWAHLVVHGMLHLQGYDHELPTDAELMETLETEIVIQLGYADPYRVTASGQHA